MNWHQDHTRYHVISPDGFPITPEPFGSRREAAACIPKYCNHLKLQGYYKTVDRRIPLKELPKHLLIAPEDMTPQFALNGQVLEKLLTDVKGHAECIMRTAGRMPPTMFLDGLDGCKTHVALSAETRQEKDRFAKTMRLMAKAHGATVVVLAIEAWVKLARPGEKLDMSKAPSECPDRQEGVVLLAETYQENVEQILPIVRAGNGQFVGLGEAQSIRHNRSQTAGRFTELLPELIPNATEREEAKKLLLREVEEIKREHGQERGMARF